MRTRQEKQNNWNADEAKENQQLDFSKPNQSQSIRHQPTFLEVFRPEPSQNLIPDPPTRNQKGKQLLTVIGLTTMYAVCCITFTLYPIFIYRRMIYRNWMLVESLQAYIFLNV